MSLDQDLASFAQAYVKQRFEIDWGGWAGDRRDHDVLTAFRTAVGERGDTVAFEALVAGLNQTSDVPGHYPVRASFIEALGHLGDPRAVPLLTEMYWKTNYDGYRRDLRQAMGRLGVDGVVAKHMELEKQAREVIRARLQNKTLERFAPTALINLAVDLLMRDGDFQVHEDFQFGGAPSKLRITPLGG